VKRLQKGFTLIELMIVIAIIAILAAILIPNFLHARAESQTSACEGNLKQIATALEEYSVDNSGQYPAAANVTTALFAGGKNANGAVYMSAPPLDPVNSAQYVYTTAAADCNLGATVGYEISDTGGHDPTTTGSIPNALANSKTIFYCSGSGLSAK
jgi:type II secretion system protein G